MASVAVSALIQALLPSPEAVATHISVGAFSPALLLSTRSLWPQMPFYLHLARPMGIAIQHMHSESWHLTPACPASEAPPEF